MSLGALGYVGYAVETVEGTAVAPTIFLPVSSFDFADTNDKILPSQIRRSRQRSVALPAPFNTSGTMDLELLPVGIAALLKSAFAAKGANTATTGAGPYTHTFTPGSSSPTFTFEASAADILMRRYGGVRVGSLEIAATFGEIVTSSWGLEGSTRSTTATPASVTLPTVDPFHFTGASITKKTVEWGNVKSFTFSIGNNIGRVGTLRKTRNYKRTHLGMLDVGFSATLDFENTAEYDEFLATEDFELVIDLEAGFVTGTSGPRHKLTITIPRVSWNSIGIPLTAEDEIEASVEATILKPSSGSIFTAVLVNNETTVPGA